MGTFTLLLFPLYGETQELELHPHNIESSIVDTIKPTQNKVFNNYEYTGQLQSPDTQSITGFCLYLNGLFVQTEYHVEDGTFLIKDESFGDKPFIECYGYVQLTVQFVAEGIQCSFDSDYVPVMVQRGIQNDSVRRMSEYVYRKNESLLFSSTMLPKDTAGLKQSSRKTIESKIFLLYKIALVFESNYAYFKINSRFTTVQAEHVDHFEKLQYVSAHSISYISQHPDALERVASSSGIKVRGNYYQPGRTLITNNIQSYDIYENQEIIGFLTCLHAEIIQMQDEIAKIIDNAPATPAKSGDYVASSFFVFTNTLTVLDSLLSDLHKLRNRFAVLLSAYANIYHIKGRCIVAPSKPTAIFMSIPQYRQAYDCMVAWFNLGVVTLNEERYMLSFLKISSLYEVYVLLKFSDFLTESGYDLVAKKRINYRISEKALYKNTSCNNLYIFQRGQSTISVYYQPVICNTDNSERTGIGLYRNTSISLLKGSDNDRDSDSYSDNKSDIYYYTPDYLLKIENAQSSSTKYVIADAKFSTLQTVKTYKVAALAYKYLFSISPIDAADEISGLLIINGQSQEETDKITDIYDKSRTPEKITPCADILTLTENSKKNTYTHYRLLKLAIGKYLTE